MNKLNQLKYYLEERREEIMKFRPDDSSNANFLLVCEGRIREIDYALMLIQDLEDV